MIAGRPCAPGTFYDDTVRACAHSSTTCALSTGNSCVTSCDDVSNGVFQSCVGCDVFVVCLNGVLVTKTCEDGMKWDDVKKSCFAVSSTCKLSTEVGQSPQVDPEPSTTSTTTTTTPTLTSDDPSDSLQPHSCVGESCDGLPAGNYQSCYTCRGYVTCAGPGHFPILRPCPANLVWDDRKKRCAYRSKTCDPSDFITTTTDNPVTSSGDGVELVHL